MSSMLRGSLLSFLFLSLTLLSLLLLTEAQAPPTVSAQYTYDGPQYGLPWQGLPQDRGLGLHVRSGRYKELVVGGPKVPELIVIANGQGLSGGLDGLAVLRNNFDWTFQVLEDDPSTPAIHEGISWKGPAMGRACDVCFLDVLNGVNPIQPNAQGDGIDDHILVIAAADKTSLPIEEAQDRLYKIIYDTQNDRYTFEEVSNLFSLVLPPETWLSGDTRHLSQTVLSTRSMDTQGNLYLILAGGYYYNKQSAGTARKFQNLDTLRILKYSLDPGNPLNPSGFRFVKADIQITPHSDLFMMDIDVLDANGDGLGDILISAWEKYWAEPPPSENPRECGAILLKNEGTGWGSPFSPVFSKHVLSDDCALGAAVGDFDDDTDEDLFILHQPGRVDDIVPPLAMPTMYENKSTLQAIEFTQKLAGQDIQWQTYRPQYNTILHNYVEDKPSYKAYTSYEAFPVEKNGRIDTIVVAGEIPYVLFKYKEQAEGPVKWWEMDLRRGYESPPQIPTLAGPLIQNYTSTDVLVEDLEGDDDLEIIFADQSEQNRLWASLWRTDILPYTWLVPWWDFTSHWFPAGGAYSQRVLVGDHYAVTPWPDLVVMINLNWSPKIYLNWYDPTKGGFYFVNWNAKFPEDEFQCASEPCAGGWDGALEDLYGDPEATDPKLDLVIAQGGRARETSRYDAVYHWDTTADRFVHHQNLDPGEDGIYVTRGVVADKLDGDECADLVMAYQYGYVGTGEDRRAAHGGLQLFLNTMVGEDCKGDYPTELSEWIYRDNPSPPPDGFSFMAVGLIKYEGGRRPDIIAGHIGANPFMSVIRVFRNYGGDYPNDPGDFVEDGMELRELTAPSGELKEGVDIEYSISRFIPMNLDVNANLLDAERDDFFIAMKKGGGLDLNYILQAGPLDENGYRTFIDPPIAVEAGGKNTWSGAAYDFDNDGYDDLITFNGGEATGVKVFHNNYVNWDPMDDDPPLLIEITNEFFLDGQPADWDFWPKNEDAYDGTIADLIPGGGENDPPEILIACDGQNRFLLPSAYRPATAGAPPGLAPGGSERVSMPDTMDFLMMAGLVGLLPPEVAVLLSPDWIPALPELGPMVK